MTGEPWLWYSDTVETVSPKILEGGIFSSLLRYKQQPKHIIFNTPLSSARLCEKRTTNVPTANEEFRRQLLALCDDTNPWNQL